MSKPKAILLVITISVLLAGALTALVYAIWPARRASSTTKVAVPKDESDRVSQNAIYEDITITMEYSANKAWIGNTDVPLTFFVKYDPDHRLNLMKWTARGEDGIYDPLQKASDATLQKNLRQQPGMKTTSDGVVNVWTGSLAISPNAAPRFAQLALYFVDTKTHETHYLEYMFAIGDREAHYHIATMDGKPLYLETDNGDEEVHLNVTNEYADYVMEVNSITITSEPGGLIEKTWRSEGPQPPDSPFQPDEPIRISPLKSQSITLHLPVDDWRPDAWFFLFTQSPSLNVSLEYGDSNHRTIRDPSSTHSVELKVRPNLAKLLLWIMAGACYGLLMRWCYLKLRKSKGAGYSLPSIFLSLGLVLIVLIVAAFGQLELQAFASKLRVAPEYPFMIFLAGVAVGILDPLDVLKKLKIGFGENKPEEAK